MSNAPDAPVRRLSSLRGRGRELLPAPDGVATHVVHNTALGRSETRMMWYSPAPRKGAAGPAE